MAPAGQLMADEESASPAPWGSASRIPAADPVYQPVYPPGPSGLRGSHPGSFEVAHQLALGGRRWQEPLGLAIALMTRKSTLALSAIFHWVWEASAVAR